MDPAETRPNFVHMHFTKEHELYRMANKIFCRWKLHQLFNEVDPVYLVPMKDYLSANDTSVHCCYVHVCFVQVTTCGTTDAPLCAHSSTVISPSWITEQISASARREHQTSFKIVTWTKQTWMKQTCTYMVFTFSRRGTFMYRDLWFGHFFLSRNQHCCFDYSKFEYLLC